MPPSPKWSDELYYTLPTLASDGHTDTQLATMLNVTIRTLEKWYADHPALKRRIDEIRNPEERNPAFNVRHIKSKKARMFLIAYAQCGNIRQAAEIAGTARTMHNHWLKNEEGYEEAFKQADEENVDRREQELSRRAYHGLRKYKFNKGAPILHRCSPTDPEGYCVGEDPDTGEKMYVKHYYELEYSDNLLMFDMKARRPEKYREKDVVINNDNSSSTTVVMQELLEKVDPQNVIVDAEFVRKEAQKRIAQGKT